MISEAKLQADCFKWAYNKHPKLRGMLFSVPNGGTRNLREAMQLKATGLTPGIPDLLLVVNGICGFEFKTTEGRLSPAQTKIHSIWAANNIPVYIINNQPLFEQIINNIMANLTLPVNMG